MRRGTTAAMILDREAFRLAAGYEVRLVNESAQPVSGPRFRKLTTGFYLCKTKL